MNTKYNVLFYSPSDCWKTMCKWIRTLQTPLQKNILNCNVLMSWGLSIRCLCFNSCSVRRTKLYHIKVWVIYTSCFNCNIIRYIVNKYYYEKNAYLLGLMMNNVNIFWNTHHFLFILTIVIYIYIYIYIYSTHLVMDILWYSAVIV